MSGRRIARAPRAILVAIGALVLGAAGCSKGYEPGLGELMSLQQMRHDKLWRAGSAGSWSLASYELDELGEGFDDIVRLHPTHKESPVSIAEVVPRIMDGRLRSVRAAIEAKDPAAFATAFDSLTEGCNTCHQATDFGFNVVRRPLDESWFGNQVFPPSHVQP